MFNSEKRAQQDILQQYLDGRISFAELILQLAVYENARVGRELEKELKR